MPTLNINAPPFPSNLHQAPPPPLAQNNQSSAGASLINFSANVSLGQNLDTGHQPFIKNASGEDMGALGQVTCTFTINNQPFTQSFIVCRHMQ